MEKVQSNVNINGVNTQTPEIMKNNFIKSVVIIFTFLLGLYGRSILDLFLNITKSIQSDLVKYIYGYSWWIISSLIVLWVLYGFKNIVKELRLNQSFFKGLLWAIAMVFPMFIGSFLMGEFNSELSFLKFIKSTFLAGFFEETFFRAFLFGQLFCRLKWGFIPAVVLNAVAFASGHLYQGNSFGETTGVFIITLMGAAWFAWLFIEWKENIWLPIWLHALMNMSWLLFDVSETALGGISANIFRAITIAVSIIITVSINKKSGGLRVNRKNLLINRS